ncbi:hypothetical protein SEVIR_2G050016v4 [Setaria viridis]
MGRAPRRRAQRDRRLPARCRRLLVRFRAACRPWREAPQLSPAPRFLPWLVESYDEIDAPGGLLVHSPFSTRKTRHVLPLSALRGMAIQGSDVSSGRRVLGLFRRGPDRRAHQPARRRRHLIASTASERVSSPDDEWRSAGGVVSSDGVVAFYTITPDDLAAIKLRPGEPGWEEADVTDCPARVEIRWMRWELGQAPRRSAVVIRRPPRSCMRHRDAAAAGSCG